MITRAVKNKVFTRKFCHTNQLSYGTINTTIALLIASEFGFKMNIGLLGLRTQYSGSKSCLLLTLMFFICIETH